MLLCSDGSAMACGMNSHGQCSIPPFSAGLSCTQVSAGGTQTVLLRRDGHAVACGMKDCGQCDIPLLDEGMFYTQVSAGFKHTLTFQLPLGQVTTSVTYETSTQA